MPDIDLRIIADTSQATDGMKDLQSVNQKFFTELSRSSEMQQDLIEGIAEGIQQEISAINGAEKAVKNTGQRMAMQLRVMREELQKMEMSGQGSSKAFQDLAVKAAKLEDQIGDTQQRIRILASDTKNLDAVISGSQGLVAGFSVAQGAIALFGKESSNLQKQMVKLQGAMALLIGMQQVANTLNKDSAFRIVAMEKAQNLYALAVGKSTGALKTFRTALLATGIGALVIAIGLLIANWDKVAQAIRRLFNPNARLLEQMEAQKKAMDDISHKHEMARSNIERQIELLTAQGNKEDEIYTKKVALANLDIAVAKESMKISELELKVLDEKIKRMEKYASRSIVLYWINKGRIKKAKEEEAELTREYEKQQDAVLDLQSEIKVLGITETNRLNKVSETVLANANKDNQATQKYYDELLELTRGFDEKQLELIDAGEREKINLRIKYLQEELSRMGAVDNVKEALIQANIAMEIELQKKNLEKLGLSEIAEREKNENLKLQGQAEYASKLLSMERGLAEQELELIGATEEEKLDLQIYYLKKQLEAMGYANTVTEAYQMALLSTSIKNLEKQKQTIKSNKEVGWWDLLGLDPSKDEDKKVISQTQEVTGFLIDSANNYFDAEAEIAEKRSSLLDDKLSHLERELNEEKRLQDQGMANNVDRVKKEMAAVTAEQNRAMNEQRKIAKNQMDMDTAIQASQLATAMAKNFSTYTGPAIAVAIALNALMLGTFIATKIKAYEAARASGTILEEGGYGDDVGVVKGKRHSQGGERFLDHVEVESGESWGVFNRQATEKYKDMIPEFVNDINAGVFPKFDMMPKIMNNNIVNVDTKKMQSQLKSINSGIDNLNSNILNNLQTHYQGGKRIEKRGNHIRIIYGKN